MSLMPQTVTTKDIQRNYRKVFDLVKKTKQPVVVLTNNKPDVAIIDAQELNRLQENSAEYELQTALHAINEAKQAEKEGTLIQAKSLAELL